MLPSRKGGSPMWTWISPLSLPPLPSPVFFFGAVGYTVPFGFLALCESNICDSLSRKRQVHVRFGCLWLRSGEPLPGEICPQMCHCFVVFSLQSISVTVYLFYVKEHLRICVREQKVPFLCIITVLKGNKKSPGTSFMVLHPFLYVQDLFSNTQYYFLVNWR